MIKEQSLTPAAGAALYLPLWQKDGAAFASADAYGHLCTNTGATWTPHGMVFDGVDDVIEIANHASLQNFSAKSVFFWLKPTVFTGAYRYVYDGSYWPVPYGDNCYLHNDDNILYIWLRNTAGDIRGTSIPYTPDTWIQFGYSWGGAGVSWYKNGSLISTSSALSGTLACSARPLRFAHSADGYFRMSGTLGEALIYNRGLTLPEMQRHYLATKWRYE